MIHGVGLIPQMTNATIERRGEKSELALKELSSIGKKLRGGNHATQIVETTQK